MLEENGERAASMVQQGPGKEALLILWHLRGRPRPIVHISICFGGQGCPQVKTMSLVARPSALLSRKRADNSRCRIGLALPNSLPPRGHRRAHSGRFRLVCRRRIPQPVAAVDVDFSDPNTLLAAGGAALGLLAGLAIPIFLVAREQRDEERIEAIRELNRQTKEATGEPLTQEEIEQLRPTRWTDKREFVDD